MDIALRMRRNRLLMKKCPFCAEEIQEEAVKCKHCMEFLDPSKRPAVHAHAMPPVPKASDGVPWYCKSGAMLITFLTVPPFALPLIWLHPKMHVAWKIALTVVIGLTCWLMYVAFVAFVEQFNEATKMLEQMQF